jgi:hypothetical protein
LGKCDVSPLHGDSFGDLMGLLVVAVKIECVATSGIRIPLDTRDGFEPRSLESESEAPASREHVEEARLRASADTV